MACDKRAQHSIPLQSESPDSEAEQYVGLDDLAHRWRCSRSSAARICAAHQVATFFLSGKRRGLRRYRFSDVCRLEEDVKV